MGVNRLNPVQKAKKITDLIYLTGPVEPVRPVRPWSDQKSLYFWSKPCIFRVLVGPIIVKLRFFLNGQTNLVLLPPPLSY